MSVVRSIVARLKETAQYIEEEDNIAEWQFDELLEFLEEELNGKRAIELGTKDGLAMRAVVGSEASYVYMVDLKDNRVIGLVQALGSRHEIEASYLEPQYRSKGYGIAMYLGAVKCLKHIRSSTDVGLMAIRTWRSLSKYHTVELVESRTNRPVEFTWGSNSIPVIDGVAMNAGENLNRVFQFEIK